MDASQWNWFLTPSTTPTDATFSPTVLQTPRTSSHFQDAFSPYAHQNQVSNTSFSSMEHMSGSAFGHDGMHTTFDRNITQESRHMHKEHFDRMAGNAGLPRSSKHTGAASFQAIRQPIPIHTPPSARPHSEKRRAIRPHSIMFGTPSSMDQVMTGQAPSLVDHSQISMLPPSSSQPLYPMNMSFQQSDLPMSDVSNQGLGEAYWDPSQSMRMTEQAGSHASGLADPFTYHNHQQAIHDHNFGTNDESNFLATTPQLFTPARSDQLQQAPIVPSNAQKPLPPAPTEGVPNMMRAGGGMNPNMLYSSPNRVGSNNPQSITSSPHFIPHADSLSPEKIPQVAFAGAAAVSSQLGMQLEHESHRPPSSGGLKGGLRRSNTGENRRPHSMYGSIESLGRSNTTSGIQRRASPLKRANRNSTTSLASILEASTPNAPRSRTSIVLTVDSKGRARAETRTMDLSPTKAIKSRYPNLWDDSDSDTDSDETTTSNKRHSFCGSKSEDRRRAKIESTLESLEGLHLPRPGSSSSAKVTPSKAAVSAAVQLRRQSSVKKPYSHSRRNTLASTGSFLDQDAMAISSDDETANGDAGAALRKARERRDQNREQAAARAQARSRPQSQGGRPTTSFPPRTTSLMNFSSPQTFEYAPLVQPCSSQVSSPVKPTGSFADAMSSLTRCICNLPIAEGQLMIQCNACQLWLHTACLGIPPNNLPATYFCTFCMAPPPQHHAAKVGWETAAAF